MASVDFTTEPFACPFDPYCLGMCSWTGSPGNADMATESMPWSLPEHDLSLRSPSCSNEPHLSTSSSRFAFASKKEMSKSAEGITPANTAKTTAWALNNFQRWMASRNSLTPSDPVPDDILQCTNPQLLNNHLSKYVVETRKSNGDFYPPSTIHQLLCSILRHMRNKNPSCPNFLDKKDCHFKQLHGTLDAYFHKLYSQRVGRQTNYIEILSSEEEDKLWNEGVMSTNTPIGLQNAAFFVVGKVFYLCGGQKHRRLQLSQLKCFDDKYSVCVLQKYIKKLKWQFQTTPSKEQSCTSLSNSRCW